MTFLHMAHSHWRWIVLLTVAVAAARLLANRKGSGTFGPLESKLVLAAQIAVRLQVTLGLILWMVMGFAGGMRFVGEHVFLALLAVGAVEFAGARSKKAETDADKLKLASGGLLGALGLFLLVIFVRLGGLV